MVRVLRRIPVVVRAIERARARGALAALEAPRVERDPLVEPARIALDRLAFARLDRVEVRVRPDAPAARADRRVAVEAAHGAEALCRQRRPDSKRRHTRARPAGARAAAVDRLALAVGRGDEIM